MIDFDIVLEQLGGFGKYQALVVSAIFCFGIPSGMNALASVFLSYSPDFRCTMYPFDNATLYPHLGEKDILNLTTPLNEDGYPVDSCTKYIYNKSSCPEESLTCINKSLSTVKCDEGYHYDKSLFTETVVTEFNLVCDKQFLQTLSVAAYMAGPLFGNFVFGLISDRFGRRVSTLVSCTAMLILMLGISFCPTVTLYTICRFFLAIFAVGANSSLFVHLMEIIGVKWRTAAGIGFQAAYAVGYVLWSPIAYIWRDWREMQYYQRINLEWPMQMCIVGITKRFNLNFMGLSQLAACVLCSPYFIIALVLPESPRWLFTSGNDKRGKELCAKISRLNNVKIDETIWKEAEKSGKEKQMTRGPKKTYSMIDLFRYPAIRILTLKVWFNWMVNSMVYYGISLNAGSLAGDIFINNVLAGVLEIGSYIFCVLTMDYIGRRLLLSVTLTGAGVALIASTIVNEYADEKQSLITFGVALAFIGKTLVSASYAVIYNFTCELYPTMIRNNAVGFGSIGARTGSVTSALVIGLQNYATWLPNSIFGTFAIVGGLLSLSFRDTTGRDMMETIEEAEMFHSGREIRRIKLEERTGYDNAVEIEESTKL